MRLLMCEIRQWLRSPALYAAILLVALFVGAQLGEDGFAQSLASWPTPPEPGLTTRADGWPAYGFCPDDSPETRMQAMSVTLLSSAQGNPVLVPTLGGFINRNVMLSEAEIAQVRAAFMEITGCAPDAVPSLEEIPILLDEAAFSARLDALNTALGQPYFKLGTQRAYRERTYEEAQTDYALMVSQDKVTRAYARYYGDYMGIALALFPALLAAFMMGKDKRSGAAALVGARPISGVRYVAVKYAGLMVPLCAAVLLAACLPTAGAVRMAWAGHDVDLLAYLAVSVYWLLPTVLATSALTLLVSVVTGSGIAAVPVALGWWFLSVGSGLEGPYGLYEATIRFNSTAAMPAAWAGQIAANRGVMIGLALAFVLGAGLVYEWKRTRGADHA